MMSFIQAFPNTHASRAHFQTRLHNYSLDNLKIQLTDLQMFLDISTLDSKTKNSLGKACGADLKEQGGKVQSARLQGISFIER